MSEAIYVEYQEFIARYTAVKKNEQWFYQSAESPVLYSAWVCDIEDIRGVELIPHVDA